MMHTHEQFLKLSVGLGLGLVITVTHDRVSNSNDCYVLVVLLSHHTVLWGLLSLMCVILFFFVFFCLNGYGLLSGTKR